MGADLAPKPGARLRELPRPFLVMGAGQVVSNLGSQVSLYALGLWLFQQQGRLSAFAAVALVVQLAKLAALAQELAAAALNVGRQPSIRLAMVRFGNVLGSSGSVVSLFREQIAKDGPITLTHPEIIRFFMTIPETAQQLISRATERAISPDQL